MEKQDINYAEIEEGMRDLIGALSQVSFVDTLSSRFGRMEHYFGTAKTEPDEGHLFLWPGYLTYKVDQEHEQAQSFLNDLSGLIGKYPYTRSYDHSCDVNRCKAEGSQIFDAGY